MLVSCWSAKGGVGTSVVAAALAVVLARRHPAGALLVDLAGDQPAVLGRPQPDGAGVGAWVAGWPDVADDALGRLELPVADGVDLLPLGQTDPAPTPPTGPGGAPDGVGALVQELLLDPRAVVVDAGLAGTAGSPWTPVVEGSTRSLLVTRACYLAVRRALVCPVDASGVVVVEEADRALAAEDVQRALGVPVVAVVPVDPAVARAVDAGLLVSRLPRRLARAVGGAA